MAAIPPCFGDLGKSARDLFEKEFDFSKVKLTLKTKTASGVEFETNGTHDTERGRTSGNLKTKLKCSEYGVVFSESWNTNSELDSELTYEPSAVEGLKLTINSSFLPSTGTKSAKLKACYKREYLDVQGDIDLLMTGPTFKGSSVFMYNGWYAGYQVGYNTSNAKLTANNLCVGYTGDDFNVNLKVADISDCTTSVYHKVKDNTEIGLCTSYNLQTSNVGLGLVGKYLMDDGTVVKAKVNNQGQIGTSYTQNLRPGIKINLSALIDAKNFNTGGHKLGAALTFDP